MDIIQRLLLFLTVLVALHGCGPKDPKAKWRAEGRAEAERDLAAGKLGLKSYGLPVRWQRKYHEMAREKLGVEYNVVAGCMVDDELVEQTEGYNEPMLREINRRHGSDALDKVWEAAKSEYEKEYGAGGR
jgi:hypothetical protein